MKQMNRARPTKKLTGRRIDVMTERERRQLGDESDRQTPARRRPNPGRPPPGRRRVRSARARQLGRGRPRLGKAGTRVVSVTVEVDLLKQADAFAAAAGMMRSELFTQGLRGILPKAG